MNPPPTTNPYTRQRFPAEIISHGVWLYLHFCLCDRAVEELMCVRGVVMTYDAIRQ
jgi:putative transposase